MYWLVPFTLGLVITWAVACGDDKDNPVSKTPSPDLPADVSKAGNVVFSPGGVNSAAQWGTDAYALGAASIANDTLAVTVSYSGGCRTHQFTLVAAAAFLESDPVQLEVAIAHNADGDPCEAYPTEDCYFMLDPIKARYKASYGVGPGTVVLRLDRAPDGPLIYAFD